MSDEWFEGRCWICGEVKTVHIDKKTTFGDPGFICNRCELYYL